MRPMKTVVNVETGEIMEREYTDEEYSAHLEDQKIIEKNKKGQAELIAKKESAFAKLAALGLTEDEIAAL